MARKKVASHNRNKTEMANTNISQVFPTNANMVQVKEEWRNLFKNGVKKGMSALGIAYNNNPYIQNQRVKRVATQPFNADRSALEKALQDLENSEQLLRQVSQSLFVNYPLLKLNNLYADILTYRWYFHSIYTNSADIHGLKYKKERIRLSKWCNLLQPQRTFQNIVLKAQREGKVAYYMRDSINENKKDFDYAYLEELPSDYVKIVGWNTASKFNISFDFTYFWQAGTSPIQFPPIFQKYYKELNDTIPPEYRNTPINPANLPTDIDVYYQDNRWFYWRTLPLDECFVFSQDESQPYQIPNTVGLFLPAQDLQDYAYLQQELLQLPLNGAVFGTMPMAKDSDGTMSADNYALGTEAFSFFTNMFDEVAPKGMRLFMSPATDFKLFKFDGDAINNSQIVNNALQQFNVTAGVGGLNTTTDKPNVSQVKSQQVLEARYVSKMYKQFENFVNVWWQNKLGLSYSWRFKIKGSAFEDMNDFAKVEKGISIGQNYLLPEYASYFDMRLEDLQSLQEEVIATKVYDKLQVVQSAFNSAKISKSENLDIDGNVNGRPKIDENKIESDGTANSIEQGTNTADARFSKMTDYCVECGVPLVDHKYGCFCSAECQEENEERVKG